MQSFFKVSWYKRLLSYLIPVIVKKGAEEDGSSLQVMLYNNSWQLASQTALYSDGISYRPFRLAFKQLDAGFLGRNKSCLVLGTGLGSIVQILRRKYKSNADFYLVEKEEKILHWAVGLLQQQGVKKIYPFCVDAASYLAQHGNQYELICVDVFKDRVVPYFFITDQFLSDCRAALLPGGVWIMNYIINDAEEWETFAGRVSSVFGSVTILESEQNRILIGNNVS